MSGWVPFVFFISAILGVLAFLLFRYARMRLGLREQAFGGVQHASRKEPPSPDEEIFLPGSRMGEDQPEVVIEASEVTGDQPSKARRLFRSKEDIRRSYIIDALLERPKF